jgi:hypothetical protein
VPGDSLELPQNEIKLSSTENTDSEPGAVPCGKWEGQRRAARAQVREALFATGNLAFSRVH